MDAPWISVRTPTRLHFGLFSFGQSHGRQFGGAGVMIDSPNVELAWHASSTFSVEGPNADRIESFAECWRRYHGLAALPPCRIEVREMPRQHAGLGVGTQLGLAVAAGMRALLKMPPCAIQELAGSVGRGERSAIGVYGFSHGGLIVEAGKESSDAISPLLYRQAIPADWRFVLACPVGETGLAGEDEREAFRCLPPVAVETANTLERWACDDLVPAAGSGDFVRFAAAVFQFNRLAGSCFGALQGGPYNGPMVTSIVEYLLGVGAVGVGQSSWGPTVFCAAPNPEEAIRMRDAVQTHFGESVQCHMASPNNRGATVAQPQ